MIWGSEGGLKKEKDGGEWEQKSGRPWGQAAGVHSGWTGVAAAWTAPLL